MTNQSSGIHCGMSTITINVTGEQLNMILLGLELVERDLESTIRSTIKALDQRLDERREIMGCDLTDHVDDQAIALRDYVDMHREAVVLFDRLRRAEPNGNSDNSVNDSGYSSWATGNSTTGCSCAGTMGVRCKPGECDSDIPF